MYLGIGEIRIQIAMKSAGINMEVDLTTAAMEAEVVIVLSEGLNRITPMVPIIRIGLGIQMVIVQKDNIRIVRGIRRIQIARMKSLAGIREEATEIIVATKITIEVKITEGEKVVIIVLIDHQDDLLQDLLMVDFGTKEARVATEGDFEFAK
jgi:hypothetical protein